MIQYHTRSQEHTQSLQKTWSVGNPFQYYTQDKKISGFSDGKNSSRKRRWQGRKERKLLQQLWPPNTEFGVVCKSWYADKCKTTCIDLHRKQQQQQQQIIQNHWRFWFFVKVGFQRSPLGSAMVTYHLQWLFSSCLQKTAKSAGSNSHPLSWTKQNNLQLDETLRSTSYMFVKTRFPAHIHLQ